MDKLPNGNEALIPIAKLIEYSFNPEHPTGRHKAYVFKSVLGLTQEDAAFLHNLIERAASESLAEQEEPNAYGARYVIDFTVTTNLGSAIVRTTWIIRNDEDFPRLTSCYVK
jgi:hypothetical protein